jgi:hypothetical protein
MWFKCCDAESCLREFNTEAQLSHKPLYNSREIGDLSTIPPKSAPAQPTYLPLSITRSFGKCGHHCLTCGAYAEVHEHSGRAGNCASEGLTDFPFNQSSYDFQMHTVDAGQLISTPVLLALPAEANSIRL